LERLEPRPALGLERRPALAERGHVLDLVLARQRGRRLAAEAPLPDPLRAVAVDERAADPAVAALQVARERLGVERRDRVEEAVVCPLAVGEEPRAPPRPRRPSAPRPSPRSPSRRRPSAATRSPRARAAAS